MPAKLTATIAAAEKIRPVVIITPLPVVLVVWSLPDVANEMPLSINTLIPYLGQRMEALAAVFCHVQSEVVLNQPEPMVEILRGPFVESRHMGHAVVANAQGDVIESWGNPTEIILPRSSAKMLQALPLLESGAGAHLSMEQLALACASHSGETRHIDRVTDWLGEMGLDETALCCGTQASGDRALRHKMIRDGQAPTRIMNNCSGKHTGFLTLALHLKADLNYVDPSHPVQVHVKSAFEETCNETSPGFGIDGCSAPNFAVSLKGLAQGMARFATAGRGSGVRDAAMAKLRDAMIAHPKLLSGEGRACAALIEAAKGRAAVKTGAEGVFVAILPDQGLGIALKIVDGATRASEVAIAALLARLGVIDAAHPMLNRPIKNWDGLITGVERAVPSLAQVNPL